MLVEPSRPGNVGATARAMRTMGLARLVLVAPRVPGVAAHPEARAFASGADDVLAGAREVATLEQALAGASLAIAVSAQPREFGPAPCGPRDAAFLALDELAAHPAHEVAFVFGCERTGLSIGHALACQSLLTIPSDPEFSSLNLSQAAQIVAWELRGEALARDAGARVDGAPRGDGDARVDGAPRGDAGARDGDAHAGSTPAGEGRVVDSRIEPPGPPDAPSDPGALALRRRLRRAAAAGRHASVDELEALYEHLQRALVDVRFLDPAHPKKLMPRLRRLFSRTRLEAEEVELLRGVCTQMVLAARTARGARSESEPRAAAPERAARPLPTGTP